MSTTCMMGICTTCTTITSTNMCWQSTPAIRRNARQMSVVQDILTAQTAATKPSPTAIMSTISSTDACITRMAIIATTTALRNSHSDLFPAIHSDPGPRGASRHRVIRGHGRALPWRPAV